MSVDVEGTVAEVLEQVGSDPELAREAYLAEQEGKARKTLLSELDEIANARHELDQHTHRPAASNGTTYKATKRLRIKGTWIEVGEVVPGADEWPRLESWIRQGWVTPA